MYNWHQLACLAVADLRKRYGITAQTGRFHYMGGSDVQGHPCIRIDLTPPDVDLTS